MPRRSWNLESQAVESTQILSPAEVEEQEETMQELPAPASAEVGDAFGFDSPPALPPAAQALSESLASPPAALSTVAASSPREAIALISTDKSRDEPAPADEPAPKAPADETKAAEGAAPPAADESQKDDPTKDLTKGAEEVVKDPVGNADKTGKDIEKGADKAGEDIEKGTEDLAKDPVGTADKASKDLGKAAKALPFAEKDEPEAPKKPPEPPGVFGEPDPTVCSPPCYSGRGVCNDNVCFCKTPYTGTTCQHTIDATGWRFGPTLTVTTAVACVILGILISHLVYSFVRESIESRMASIGEETVNKESWMPSETGTKRHRK